MWTINVFKELDKSASWFNKLTRMKFYCTSRPLSCPIQMQSRLKLGSAPVLKETFLCRPKQILLAYDLAHLWCKWEGHFPILRAFKMQTALRIRVYACVQISINLYKLIIIHSVGLLCCQASKKRILQKRQREMKLHLDLFLSYSSQVTHTNACM